MYFFARSDTGKVRNLNEDYCFATDSPIGGLENLFIVCDGMGGHNAGEYASEQTIKRVIEEIRKNNISEPIDALREAICSANDIILDRADHDINKAGMGTTLVAATIKDGTLIAANVGDSRLYVADEQGLVQVTRDHSYVEEMVSRGIITREEARTHRDKNMITRAIGVTPKVKIDFFDVEAKKGLKVLLCTDGLTNMVEDEIIEQTITSVVDTKTKVESLVRRANENGGKDNITVLLIEIED